MPAETIQREMPAEVSPTLAAYSQLVGDPGFRSTYGAQVEQEASLLGIERATVEEERHAIDTERDALGRVPDADFDNAHLTFTKQVGIFVAHDTDLRRRELFADRRETLWGNGGMLFERDDPTVSELVGGLVAGAETEEQPFMTDTEFNELADSSQPRLVIEAKEQPLELPLASVVSAIGFVSWGKGRGGTSHDKVSEEGGPARSSRAVMEDYASRDTPPPPLDGATALIFEDGRVIIKASDAHRAGAAKLRGQSTIQIKELRVVRAKERSPRQVVGEGLGVVAAHHNVAVSESASAQGDNTVNKVNTMPPNGKGRWRSFIAGVNYHRKHRRH